jgi:hypothetical protein
MKVVNNFQSFLNESKIDQYKNTFVVDKQIIDQHTFDLFAAADEHPYVMLPWMVKVYSLLKERKNIVKEIINLSKQFKQYKHLLPNKDINYYDYSTLLSELAKIKVDSLNKKIEKVEGAELVLDLGTKKLYKIYTMQAAQKYGAATRWCISATMSQNAWDNYRHSNIFYFLIDSKPSRKNCEKVAIQVKKPDFSKRVRNLDITFWNSIDNEIAYILPKAMQNYIESNLKNKDYVEQTDQIRKEKEKETRSIKNLIIKAEKEQNTVIDPAFYLKDNLDVPKDMLIRAVDVDLRLTNITSLRNLKIAKDLILLECQNLISLGQLERIEHFGDFRGCANLKDFPRLQFVAEAYVDANTSQELKDKLKSVCQDIVEL